MDTVLQLLRGKGNEVWTIRSDETVLDAIQKMAVKNVGSLVVIEDGKPVGIFTERHYAREVFLKGRHSPTTSIREVMSTHIVCGPPEPVGNGFAGGVCSPGRSGRRLTAPKRR